MAALTKEIINRLNKELTDMGVGFEYKLNEDSSITPVAVIKSIDPMGFVESSTINCIDTYYNWLVTWFLDNYNMNITFNNTRSTIWSKDF